MQLALKQASSPKIPYAGFRAYEVRDMVDTLGFIAELIFTGTQSWFPDLPPGVEPWRLRGILSGALLGLRGHVDTALFAQAWSTIRQAKPDFIRILSIGWFRHLDHLIQELYGWGLELAKDTTYRSFTVICSSTPRANPFNEVVALNITRVNNDKLRETLETWTQCFETTFAPAKLKEGFAGLQKQHSLFTEPPSVFLESRPVKRTERDRDGDSKPSASKRKKSDPSDQKQENQRKSTNTFEPPPSRTSCKTTPCVS